MRKAVVATNQGIIIKEVSVPDLEPGTIRIKTVVSLISPGTESNIIRKAREGILDSEIVMGYNSAGVVKEVAPNVTKFKSDDRVAGTKWCMASHATEAVVPQNTSSLIPDNVSSDEAVFAGLAGTGMHAVRRVKVEMEHYCVVAGAGLIGQFCSQYARFCSAHVMVWDKFPKRLQIAENCGAEAVVNISNEDPYKRTQEFTNNRGVERGIIAVGGGNLTEVSKALETILNQPNETLGVILTYN